MEWPHSTYPNSRLRTGRRFWIAHQDGRVYHRHTSTPGAEDEGSLEVHYAIGSGTRGQSYLVEKAGRLDQSPVSWFAQANAWDLSPGFAPIFPSERVIMPACLFCGMS